MVPLPFPDFQKSDDDENVASRESRASACRRFSYLQSFKSLQTAIRQLNQLLMMGIVDVYGMYRGRLWDVSWTFMGCIVDVYGIFSWANNTCFCPRFCLG